MESLAALITELENKVSFIEQKNTVVSQASVGWHVEHSLLAMIKMISATEHSIPADYKQKFNMRRLIVLILGKIPRGKAKAPSTVRPAGETSIETIQPLIEKARQKTASFEKLSSNKYFTHPVFGDLLLSKARKVIAIHTRHHLRIIDDIIGK